MKILNFAFILIIIFTGSANTANSDMLCKSNKKVATKTDSVEHNEDINEIELCKSSQKEAGINIKSIKSKPITKFTNVPGEVIPDPSLFSTISVRVSCQVEKLWVTIGQNVKKGDPLVTLSSIEVAETQGKLLNYYNDWKRFKNLVKTNSISKREYKKAEIEFYKMISILISYGMTRQQVMDLIKNDNPSKITGNFTILSPQDGKIYTDNLALGKRFVEDKEDGIELLSIIDDSSLWVEASLPGNDVGKIKKGANVLISSSESTLAGKVIQVYPKLDPITRTQKIIISISNNNRTLHSGEFVDCRVEIERMQYAIVVPESSIFRLADGCWVVYEEIKPNHFKQTEVTLIDTIGKKSIIEGIESGSKIVTNGAFALHSELLKSSFSTKCH